MKRRLLSISTLYPAPVRPGFGRFVARQMEALAARGDWDVTVINPIGLPPPPFSNVGRYKPLSAIPQLETGGPIPVYHPRFTLIPRLSMRINYLMIAHAVLPLARRLHAEAPFDLVDAQFFYPDGPAAARVAAALGLPHAIKARGSDIHLWGQSKTALGQMRRAARDACAVLAVSAALARDMDTLGLAPPSGITVHYTGLDHARFQPLHRAEARARLAASLPALSLRPQDRLAVCVGALITIKGQALAIEALTSLPGDIHLALAGTGADEAALRARAAALGISSRVHMLGAVSHDVLPTLLSAADVMVLPSEREGLANAWIEALACGTPLVIPPIGGAGEVIACPAAGRLAERTPAAIAAAIADLLAAPPAQADVAACAARFSWAANAAALAGIYEKAVSGA
ncbi:glycosyltransferase [Novosphingobium sp. PASSN1]|uniref:glycosyltransferase n=1 Tax=Novosphingobium sp. PASSN1 TaxID=2015561 RepID=UPI000BD96A55|nr:glycosyltransferase [Novosphingobium sp. PASSN1]OYU36955.1 MAG: glycoside hydrolase [Novosphingobium sp. PASSN1]